MQVEWDYGWRVFFPASNEETFFFGRIAVGSSKTCAIVGQICDEGVYLNCDRLMFHHCIMHQDALCCKCDFNRKLYLTQYCESMSFTTFPGRHHIRI
jgi:hypothetical protein